MFLKQNDQFKDRYEGLTRQPNIYTKNMAETPDGTLLEVTPDGNASIIKGANCIRLTLEEFSLFIELISELNNNNNFTDDEPGFLTTREIGSILDLDNSEIDGNKIFIDENGIIGFSKKAVGGFNIKNYPSASYKNWVKTYKTLKAMQKESIKAKEKLQKGRM